MELSLSTSLLIFLTIQIVAGVWWASSINTTLKNLNELMKEMKVMIHQHDGDIYSKTTAASDFAKRDLKVDAAFKEIDKNRNNITELKTLVKNG